MKTREFPFSDLLSKVVDNRGRTCPTSDNGIPLIATNCIRNESLYPRYEKVRYVSQETYDTWFRGHPEPGDLIFVCKGSPGRVCLVPDPVDFCIAQDMVAVRADPNKIYNRYLLAVLRMPAIQERIVNLHVGTLIPHFKKGDFDKLLIPVPDWEAQIGVGNLYYQLSRKIAINERIATASEALLRSLFNLYGAHSEAIQVDNLGSLVRDSVNPGEVSEREPYIGLEHMPRRSVWLNSWGESAEVDSTKRAFRKGDILFGKLRPYFHKVGLAQVDGICSTDIIVVRAKRQERRTWLLMALSSDEVVAHATARSDGTRMPRAKWADLASFEVPWPHTDVVTRFENEAAPLIERVERSSAESRTLTALRDTLLPQLISGKLRVRDAERIVEDAL